MQGWLCQEAAGSVARPLAPLVLSPSLPGGTRRPGQRCAPPFTSPSPVGVQGRPTLAAGSAAAAPLLLLPLGGLFLVGRLVSVGKLVSVGLSHQAASAAGCLSSRAPLSTRPPCPPTPLPCLPARGVHRPCPGVCTAPAPKPGCTPRALPSVPFNHRRGQACAARPAGCPGKRRRRRRHVQHVPAKSPPRGLAWRAWRRRFSPAGCCTRPSCGDGGGEGRAGKGHEMRSRPAPPTPFAPPLHRMVRCRYLTGAPTQGLSWLIFFTGSLGAAMSLLRGHG